MKFRSGFVSNSSSSSFILYTDELPYNKVARLKGMAEHHGWDYLEDQGAGTLTFYTDMDNFGLDSYAVDILKIPETNIKVEY